MKKLILIVSLVLSASAFARETVSFTYFGNEGGRNSYYACSYVEGQTEQYLEMFGATNLDVRCSGGIMPNGYMQPVSIRASFDLPVVTGSAVDSVVIEGDTWNPACGVNVRIINTLLKKFSNVEVLKKRDSCAFATTNYYYLLNVTR